MSRSEALAHELPAGRLAGAYDARFAPVVDAFVRNFHERDEVGASLCVTLDGEQVVDVWGGAADPTTGRPWEQILGEPPSVTSVPGAASASLTHPEASRSATR